MAAHRDKGFNPMSPRSEAPQVDSFQSTPETRLPMFSPEDGPSKASGRSGRVPAHLVATPARRLPITAYPLDPVAAQFENDPFVVSPARGTGLSPTASAFKPLVNSRVPQGYNFSGQNSIISPQLSDDMMVSRVLEVSASTPVSVSDVGNYLAAMFQKGTKLHGGRQLEAAGGRVRVYFEDLRDAGWAFSGLRQAKNGWIVCYINTDQSKNASDKLNDLGQICVYAAPPRGTIADPTQVVEATQKGLNSQGQLFALSKLVNYPDGSFRGVAQFCKAADAAQAVQALNHRMVDGIFLEIAAPPRDRLPAANQEDLTAAMHGLSMTQAPNTSHQHLGSGTRVPSGVYQPAFSMQSMQSMQAMQAMQSMQSMQAMHPTMLPSSNMPYVVDGLPQGPQFAHMNQMTPYPMVGPLYQTPPSPALTANTGFSPSRFHGYGVGNGFGRFDMRRQQVPRPLNAPSNRPINSNTVQLKELIAGRDCRTTVMLRNIPNKVDQPMLKRIIDQSSFGRYDFMYLRIDFANECNVGYAFINFAKAEYIIPFMHERASSR
ncbi:hypothetical protein FZEAL_9559, partial [Fusarium zealandicum]